MGRHRKEEVVSNGKNEVVKDKIRDYLATSWESMIEDIDSLDAKDRVDRRLKLMEYVMPKVQSVKGEAEKKRQSAAQTILGQLSEYDEGYTEEEEIPDELGEEDL